MTVMMWVMGIAVVLILIGFIAIIGFVNEKMKELDAFKEALELWKDFIENNLESDIEPEEENWDVEKL